MHQTKSTYYRENELKHTDHHEENGLENRQHIENSQTLVQFGAGNIGRSFIGQLFSRAGFEVVFIDIDETLVNQLNAAGGYSVVVKEPAGDTTIYVDHVRAINGRDVEAAAQAVKEAAYIATSVGSGALPHIFPVLAEGLMRRDGPVDIIIAENIRHGASVFRSGLARYLPSSSSLDTQVGFVETSIGKMVPMMTEEDISSDPLQVFAEAYNTLIVDRNGIIGPIPPLSGMQHPDRRPERLYRSDPSPFRDAGGFTDRCLCGQKILRAQSRPRSFSVPGVCRSSGNSVYLGNPGRFPHP